LSNLPNYTAYARLLIDGHPSNPFSISTLPPPTVEEDRLAIVRGRSQRQYAQPVDETQSRIDRELATASR
jgi:hypothetical protein